MPSKLPLNCLCRVSDMSTSHMSERSLTMDCSLDPWRRLLHSHVTLTKLVMRFKGLSSDKVKANSLKAEVQTAHFF